LRYTVFNYRHRLGLTTTWRAKHRASRRTRHAELDRLWARLSLEEKRSLLLQQQAVAGSQ
jgi:hypothetical protein